MDLASAFYLGFTILFLLVFIAIVLRTYGSKQKLRGEEPKYRMMDDD